MVQRPCGVCYATVKRSNLGSDEDIHPVRDDLLPVWGDPNRPRADKPRERPTPPQAENPRATDDLEAGRLRECLSPVGRPLHGVLVFLARAVGLLPARDLRRFLARRSREGWSLRDLRIVGAAAAREELGQ